MVSVGRVHSLPMKIPYLLVLILAGAVSAAETSTQPSLANNDPPREPRYPVSYGAPTTQQVKTVLDRVRQRLEASVGSSIVTRGSKEPAKELSKPGDYVLDS